MNAKLITATVGLTIVCALSSGIATAGFKLPNGTQLNGVALNGQNLNGMRLNGIKLNGMRLNGQRLNGLAGSNSKSSISVRTITLPDGSAITVQDGGGVTGK